MGEERRERLPAVLLRVDFPTAALAKASAGRGEPEKIRLCLFSLRASNRIPIPRLLLLMNLHLQIITYLCVYVFFFPDLPVRFPFPCKNTSMIYMAIYMAIYCMDVFKH